MIVARWIVPAVRLAVLSLTIAGVAACTGRPVGLSAQAGSSVLIPLRGIADLTLIGFGGADAPDYQRGQLVFRLDGPTGLELVTRATSAVAAASTTKAARTGTGGGPWQIVSLVDVPAGAPLGTHTLHIVRRRIENGTPVEYAFPAYPAEIQILPSQVAAGAETVTGAPTPFEADVLGTWLDQSASMPDVTPDPQLRFQLNGPTPQTQIWAAELTVTYPPAIADVLDVVEPPASRTQNLATVWFQETTAGTLRIKVVGQKAQFKSLALVFALDDGSAAILDPNTVSVTVDKAFNESGSPVSATIASKMIF